MNVATCHVVSCGTVCIYVGILSRLLLGPITLSGVVVMHYVSRIAMVSFLTMLTFKTILKTFFVLDFDKMASIPEGNVMLCLWTVNILLTSAQVSAEVYMRHTRGLHHFGSLCLSTHDS